MCILGFLVLEIFTIKAAFSSYATDILGYCFILGAIIQELSYILVAISNPGIATEADFDTEGEEQASQTKKYIQDNADIAGYAICRCFPK